MHKQECVIHSEAIILLLILKKLTYKLKTNMIHFTMDPCMYMICVYMGWILVIILLPVYDFGSMYVYSDHYKSMGSIDVALPSPACNFQSKGMNFSYDFCHVYLLAK